MTRAAAASSLGSALVFVLGLGSGPGSWQGPSQPPGGQQQGTQGREGQPPGGPQCPGAAATFLMSRYFVVAGALALAKQVNVEVMYHLTALAFL